MPPSMLDTCTTATILVRSFSRSWKACSKIEPIRPGLPQIVLSVQWVPTTDTCSAGLQLYVRGQSGLNVYCCRCTYFCTNLNPAGKTSMHTDLCTEHHVQSSTSMPKHVQLLIVPHLNMPFKVLDPPYSTLIRRDCMSSSRVSGHGDKAPMVSIILECYMLILEKLALKRLPACPAPGCHG